MSLFIPASHAPGETWLPSEVRRRLVAARAGEASPLLREADGSDARQALAFSVNENNHLETLMGSEAVAALDLLNALHGGELDSFVIVDDKHLRIDPRYWEPRHDAAIVCVGDATRAVYVPPVLLPLEEGRTVADQAAWDRRLKAETAAAKEGYRQDLEREQAVQRSALLWGEDTISNHPDRPVEPDFVGTHVLILRDAARHWLKGAKIREGVDRRSKKAPNKALMAQWVEENIALPVREVRARKIRETWPGPDGTEPTAKVALAALEALRGPPTKRGRPVGA